jgi:hypothetical protein
MEARKFKLLAVLGSIPSTSQAGIEAKPSPNRAGSFSAFVYFEPGGPQDISLRRFHDANLKPRGAGSRPPPDFVVELVGVPSEFCHAPPFGLMVICCQSK